MSAMERFFQARFAYPAELQSRENINVKIKNFTLDVYSLKKKKAYKLRICSRETKE